MNKLRDPQDTPATHAIRIWEQIDCWWQEFDFDPRRANELQKRCDRLQQLVDYFDAVYQADDSMPSIRVSEYDVRHLVEVPAELARGLLWNLRQATGGCGIDAPAACESSIVPGFVREMIDDVGWTEGELPPGLAEYREIELRALPKNKSAKTTQDRKANAVMAQATMEGWAKAGQWYVSIRDCCAKLSSYHGWEKTSRKVVENAISRSDILRQWSQKSIVGRAIQEELISKGRVVSDQEIQEGITTILKNVPEKDRYETLRKIAKLDKAKLVELLPRFER